MCDILISLPLASFILVSIIDYRHSLDLLSFQTFAGVCNFLIPGSRVTLICIKIKPLGSTGLSKPLNARLVAAVRSKWSVLDV